MTINYDTEISSLIKQEDVESITDELMTSISDYVSKTEDVIGQEITSGGLSQEALNIEGDSPLTDESILVLGYTQNIRDEMKSIGSKLSVAAVQQRYVELNDLKDKVEEYISELEESQSELKGLINKHKYDENPDQTALGQWNRNLNIVETKIEKYEQKLEDIASELSKLSFTTPDGYTIDFSEIEPGSRVALALEEYASQIDSAEIKHITKDTLILEETVEYNGFTFKRTHVLVNDPSQLTYEPANGKYASGVETTSAALKRTGAVAGFNGSHFITSSMVTSGFSLGQQDTRNPNLTVAIVNGEVKYESGTTSGFEWCLDKDGNFFSAPKGISAQSLIDDYGVVSTFTCHEDYAIKDGNINYGVGGTQVQYNKTIVGSKDACDFYVISGYMHTKTGAEYLKSLGCDEARSLDMGGSTTAIVDDNITVVDYDGTFLTSESDERAIGDFLLVYDTSSDDSDDDEKVGSYT